MIGGRCPMAPNDSRFAPGSTSTQPAGTTPQQANSIWLHMALNVEVVPISTSPVAGRICASDAKGSTVMRPAAGAIEGSGIGMARLVGKRGNAKTISSSYRLVHGEAIAFGGVLLAAPRPDTNVSRTEPDRASDGGFASGDPKVAAKWRLCWAIR